MEHYRTTKRIGEGAHGYVLKAVHLLSGKEVAIKKLLQRVNYHRDNNFICNVREIETMQHINHENIIQLIEVISIPTGIGIVMEYMPINLNAVLYDPDIKLTPGIIKSYLLMILSGVEYLHENNIMHRDLKPANLLVSSKGVLKIADFGLSRVFGDGSRLYSHQVATRWYRAPELLWSARRYTESIDMWSIGCILGEMVTRNPLFPGISDIDQLSLVIQVLGSPSVSRWPDLVNLPDYQKISFADCPGQEWDEIIPGASGDLLDLISSLLEYNPELRPNATQALTHDYLWTYPLPATLSEMPSPNALKKAVKEKGPLDDFLNAIKGD